MKNNICIFCTIEKSSLKKHVIASTKHFWVMLDGFPIAKHHFLIIPKKHRQNYSFLPTSHFKELEMLLSGLHKYIPEKEFFAFEHGTIGQSVKHAHIHSLPLKISLDKIIKSLDVPGKKKELTKIKDLKKYKKYFMFMQKGNLSAFIPNNIKNIEPAIISNTLAKLLNMPFPANKRKPLQEKAIKQYSL